MLPYIGIVAIIFFIKAVTYFSGEIRAWTFFPIRPLPGLGPLERYI